MHVRQNIAIINSIDSKQEYILQAQKNKAVYSFSSSCGKLNWLQGEYAYLSANGLSSILRRLGIKHDIIREDSIEIENLRYYDFIFVPNAYMLSKKLIDMLLIWIQAGDGLFVSGKSNFPKSFLGLKEYKTYRPENYIGIRWEKQYNSNLLEELPLSPPEYEIVRVKAAPEAEAIGSLIEYSGFRNGSLKELQLNADALIRKKKVTYLPIPIFEFVGGLLQGHVDIEPLRTFLGIESNFYLDKICAFIKGILEEIGFYTLCYARLKLWGSYDNVFVLRHDTDSSCDSAYFNYELENNIPATYAVLLDENKDTWTSKILKVPFLECAYHFRTNREGFIFKSLKKIKIIRDESDKDVITKKGLLKQVLVAQKKCRFKFKTLHRHFSYFFYPETLEAMKFLYDSHAQILGMGTMFRFTNIRYGKSKEDNNYTVNHPDVSVPFWFPFKMAISTLEYFEILRGWDITSLIEPNFELTDLVFKNSRLISNGVYTFGFHPAHARGKKFNVNGNFQWFLYSLEMAKKNNWWFANCEMVYKKLNDWEDIVFRFDENLITLYNPTDKDIKDIFIEFDLEVKEIKGIEEVSNTNIELVHPGLLTIPKLKPKEKIKFRVIT